MLEYLNSLFMEKPTGAAISLIYTKQVPLSVSICKIIGDVDQASEINPTDEPIEFIDQIIVSGPSTNLNLFTNDSYEKLAIFDKSFICKEYPIPDVKVNRIHIIHRLFLTRDGYENKENGKQMKIYVHMQGAFLLSEFVEEIDKELLTNVNIPFTEIFIKMDNFDLSQGIECMNEDQAYDDCIYRNTLQFLNDTIGCSLHLRR